MPCHQGWCCSPRPTARLSTAMSEFSASGKVVVVTGGANGIGAALCRRFASEGASKVVVVDLNLGVAQSLAATLPDRVGVAMGADCGSELDLRRVILQTEFEHGPIGVFVANAGIPSNGSFDVTDSEWQRIWRINTMQQLWVARHLFPRWITRSGGSLARIRTRTLILILGGSHGAAAILSSPRRRQGC